MPRVLDKNGRELSVGDRVRIEGAGFEHRHLGLIQKSDGVNACVRIFGLLGNPYWFTAAFDGVIEDSELVETAKEAATGCQEESNA
jgi:hypothetical protein